MKKIIALVLVVVLTGAGWWIYNQNGEEVANPYRFVTAEEGNLEAVVSSTGTLEAVTTVQVGTQVSGIVSDIYVDFNDHVRRGQIIARIDTTLLVSAVRDAQANLERNQAQLDQASREYKRINDLYVKQFSTDVDYNLAKYNLDVALASTKSAVNNLERARRNLDYATIRAPISGVVIERNVDVGQTVAASFSAPQLFLIARDLSQMQILASVDESDIGRIEEGQEARFTVQAFDERSFMGRVRQVRLQSTIQENVVNYTVVVDVDNADGSLLPGMTATVEFIIKKATDVIKVPNAAIRFRPTPGMIAAVRKRMQQRRANLPDSIKARFAGRQGGQGGGGGGFGGENRGNRGGFGEGRRRPNVTMLWYLDADGNVAVSRVRTGITDGQMTEVRGQGIEAGMNIIAGVTQSAESSSNNPFQNSQQSRRRFGGF